MENLFTSRLLFEELKEKASQSRLFFEDRDLSGAEFFKEAICLAR